jgi:formylglycine-generating enzyme required for sulfatase activity
MLSRILLFVALLTGPALVAADAHAERRVALVVGNARYENAATLRNPRNDAGDMAELLKKLGFDVLLGLDLNEQDFAGKIEQFAQMLDDADVGLFFYAGHGLQVNERNYLVSTNARLGNPFLVASETIDLESIVRLMESKTPVNLVFLDACRNNPLRERLERSLGAMKRSVVLGRGLARIDVTSRDTLIAFSAAPGQEAADGNSRNSPFTASLLRHISQPGLEVSVMLKEVTADVRRETRNSQRPQQLSDMSRTFYFVPPSQVARVDVTPVPAPAPPPAPAQAAPKPSAPPPEDRSLEMAFWNAAQAANECEATRAYLQTFPKGIFVALAKLSERRLCKTAAPGAHSQVATLPPVATPLPSSASRAEVRPVPAPPHAPPVSSTGRPRTADAPAPSTMPPMDRLRVPPVSNHIPPPAAPSQQAMRIAPPPPAPNPAPLPAGASFRDCADCPSMIDVAGGTFVMGSNEDRTEKPPHQVAVQAFALSQFPVTVAEWKHCAAENACPALAKGEDDEPMRNVSWSDAQRYIAWLSKRTGAHYRLPSEAEWEYAARAKTETRYWWGNALAPGHANCKGCGGPYEPHRPMKVAVFRPNPLGFYAITGGVAQWVSDCWHKDYAGGPTHGGSWEEPHCQERVLRGGSWMNDPSYLRTASRDHYEATVRYPTHGFRVARSPR